MYYYKLSTTDCYKNPSKVFIRTRTPLRSLEQTRKILHSDVTGNEVQDIEFSSWIYYWCAWIYYGAQTPDNWYGETTTMWL